MLLQFYWIGGNEREGNDIGAGAIKQASTKEMRALVTNMVTTL